MTTGMGKAREKPRNQAEILATATKTETLWDDCRNPQESIEDTRKELRSESKD
jgi:hypothetical protein